MDTRGILNDNQAMSGASKACICLPPGPPSAQSSAMSSESCIMPSCAPVTRPLAPRIDGIEGTGRRRRRRAAVSMSSMNAMSSMSSMSAMIYMILALLVRHERSPPLLAEAGLSVGGVTGGNDCFDALQAAKGDDNLVNKTEYVTFVNTLSDDCFTFPQYIDGEVVYLPVDQFNYLPIELMKNFNRLSCGGNFTICSEAYLYTEGSAEDETPTDVQTIYLFHLCKGTEEAIRTSCPDPTPQPTPLPTLAPIIMPTDMPTDMPTVMPTDTPTLTPAPTTSLEPTSPSTPGTTEAPTLVSSTGPTFTPAPTLTPAPSAISPWPTFSPTLSPAGTDTSSWPTFSPTLSSTGSTPTLVPTWLTSPPTPNATPAPGSESYTGPMDLTLRYIVVFANPANPNIIVQDLLQTNNPVHVDLLLATRTLMIALVENIYGFRRQRSIEELQKWKQHSFHKVNNEPEREHKRYLRSVATNTKNSGNAAIKSIESTVNRKLDVFFVDESEEMTDIAKVECSPSSDSTDACLLVSVDVTLNILNENPNAVEKTLLDAFNAAIQDSTFQSFLSPPIRGDIKQIIPQQDIVTSPPPTPRPSPPKYIDSDSILGNSPDDNGDNNMIGIAAGVSVAFIVVILTFFAIRRRKQGSLLGKHDLEEKDEYETKRLTHDKLERADSDRFNRPNPFDDYSSEEGEDSDSSSSEESGSSSSSEESESSTEESQSDSGSSSTEESASESSESSSSSGASSPFKSTNGMEGYGPNPEFPQAARSSYSNDDTLMAKPMSMSIGSGSYSESHSGSQILYDHVDDGSSVDEASLVEEGMGGSRDSTSGSRSGSSSGSSSGSRSSSGSHSRSHSGSDSHSSSRSSSSSHSDSRPSGLGQIPNYPREQLQTQSHDDVNTMNNMNAMSNMNAMNNLNTMNNPDDVTTLNNMNAMNTMSNVNNINNSNSNEEETSQEESSSEGSSGWESSEGESSSTNTGSVESFDPRLSNLGSSTMSASASVDFSEDDVGYDEEGDLVDQQLLPAMINPAVNPAVQRGVMMVPVEEEDEDDSTSYLSEHSDIGPMSSHQAQVKRDPNVPSGQDIQAAIEKGDWAAVGATAAILVSDTEGTNPNNSSTQGGSSRSESSSLDAARAAEIDQLVESGNWDGVVAVAARYADDASIQSSYSNSRQSLEDASLRSSYSQSYRDSSIRSSARSSSGDCETTSEPGHRRSTSLAGESVESASVETADASSYSGMESQSQTTYSGTSYSEMTDHDGGESSVSEGLFDHNSVTSSFTNSMVTSSYASRGGLASSAMSSASGILSSTSASTEEKHQMNAYRAEVEALVRRVVPDEIDNIDDIMVQFSGREEELIDTLRAMQEKSIAARARAAVQKSAKEEARRGGASGASVGGTSGPSLHYPDDSSEEPSTVKDALSISSHKRSIISSVGGESITNEFAGGDSTSKSSRPSRPSMPGTEEEGEVMSLSSGGSSGGSSRSGSSQGSSQSSYSGGSSSGSEFSDDGGSHSSHSSNGDGYLSRDNYPEDSHYAGRNKLGGAPAKDASDWGTGTAAGVTESYSGGSGSGTSGSKSKGRMMSKEESEKLDMLIDQGDWGGIIDEANSMNKR